MQITATHALDLIESGRATVHGWTRNDADNRVVIVTNHEHCRTDHAECGNRYDEGLAEQELERLADEYSAKLCRD